MITQKEVYINAVNHGWWEEPREFGELIGLVHSEISEVLEECRDGKGITEIYYDDKGKPCGIPIEIADIAIRLMDIAEFYEFSIEEYLYNDYDTYDFFTTNFNVVVTALHSYLPFISFIGNSFDNNKDQNIENIRGIVYSINQICKKFGIDLVIAIEIKHNYNVTRPYKHGGKKF